MGVQNQSRKNASFGWAVSSSIVREVVENGLCSGCGGCAAVAPDSITMRRIKPGYLRPVESRPATAVEHRRIAEICPGKILAQEKPATGSNHHLWGPLVGVRAGFSTDEEVRFKASSGGALSAILNHLLESGTVDAVLQTGQDDGLPIANKTVLSVTEDDVFYASGSRYAPSAPLDGLHRHLDGDRKLAFVGKPCDVAALRAMARFDPRVNQRFPIMISFFCAGVPSLTGARAILDAMKIEEKDLVQFRYRGEGWPGMATATKHDGCQKSMSYAESWGDILSKHLQWRCKICPDGTGSFADIVCADAWEADEKGYPTFDEREGMSLVLSRTPAGEAIVREAMTEGHLQASEYPVDAIDPIQPGQVRKRQSTLPRLAAMRLMHRPVPSYRGFRLALNTTHGGLWQAIKSFLGTVRRARSIRESAGTGLSADSNDARNKENTNGLAEDNLVS